jgi:peptidyl-prolyl cis-trans isomerase D
MTMLETIRKFTKSAPAVALLSLLIVAFGAWGIGDILRMHGGEPPVARVADQSISARDLQQAFESRVALIRDQEGYKNFDAEQARVMGLDRQILEELIQLRAFDQAGQDLGITVPDSLIAKEIEDNADLKTSGRFDRTKFEAWLREHNLNEDRYVAMMRSLITEQSLLAALAGGLNVPKAMAWPLIAYQAERRTVRYVTLPPDAAGALPPVTEADIAKFYDENKAGFMAPEYRRITFVDIDPADIAKTVSATDAEISARYEEHKTDYSAPEKRKLEQLIFQDEGKARTAADQLKSGRSFAEIAATEGRTQADIDLGEKTRTALSPKLADAVFAAPSGGVAGPIEGEFGWTLIHVVSVTPAEQKTLAAMHDQIAKDIAKDKSIDEANKLGHKVEDEREKGTLEAAAKSAGLAAVTIDAVDSTGKDPKGEPVAQLAGKPAILDDAFKRQAGEDTDMNQTPDGAYYVVRVDAVTPPAQKPLASVSDEIRKELEGEKRATALQARAKDLAKRGAAGETIDALGSSIGVAARKSDPLGRQSSNETFSSEALAQIFTAPMNGFIAAQVGQGEGVILAQVDSIQKPSDDEIASIYQRELLQRQGTKLLGNEIAGEYATALVARYKVKRDEQAFQRAFGGS